MIDTSKKVIKITYEGEDFPLATGTGDLGAYIDGTITTINSATIGSATSIRGNAFNGLAITTVEIPSTVTSIGENAFANNQISSLTLNEGLQTIGASAFSNNPITTLTIPTTVTSIGVSAFGETQITELDMTNVHIPPTVDVTSFPSTLTSIYVAYSDYDTYLANWSAYADKIVRGLAIPSTITVTVNNYLGEFVNGASVTISGNGQTYTGTTDTVGVFSQDDLQPATYTVSVSDLEGFKTPTSQEVVVEEDTQNSVAFTYLEKPQGVEFDRVFGNNSYATISAVSAEIEANNYSEEQIYEIYGWSIGDTVPIVISGANHQMRIIDFLHDEKEDGSGKAGITLDTVSPLSSSTALNNSNKYPGWESCSFRTNTLPTIKETLSQEVKDVIKRVKKPYQKGINSTGKSIDDLFILSATEVAGNNIPSFVLTYSDGYQYKYYANNSWGKGRGWKLRSFSKTGNNYAMIVNGSGTGIAESTGYLNQTTGTSIAFCI